MFLPKCSPISLRLIVSFFSLTMMARSGDAADTGVIDFQRDVAPIFSTRCLECHNAKNAKNDFRIDDPDAVISIVEPGDVEASSLWNDHLRTDDADMMMPPASHNGPLSPTELALISVWIAEGANWPEGATVGEGMIAAVPVAAPPMSLLTRLWKFQGYLHPAAVHFPIALLLVAGLFVVVGVKYPALGDNVALVCLFIGTTTSIAATMMGWSFAVTRGYGDWSRIDMDSEIFWHRWSAITVTLAAIITSLFAIAALWKPKPKLAAAWKIGALLLAAMVGAVGHQGGELTYGKSHFEDAFNALMGTTSIKATESPSPATPTDA